MTGKSISPTVQMSDNLTMDGVFVDLDFARPSNLLGIPGISPPAARHVSDCHSTKYNLEFC
ncbi:hypothetical protein TIFTF001_019645 [Ficus carica]|uniref:Uncharacterized protein n=1 Tax=Ficus carica TaxID=3494 RepID=A0AA88DCX0_FICCA|nr:hypothetical protein TIFTF001_019645 [Ficus carica]